MADRGVDGSERFHRRGRLRLRLVTQPPRQRFAGPVGAEGEPEIAYLDGVVVLQRDPLRERHLLIVDVRLVAAFPARAIAVLDVVFVRVLRKDRVSAANGFLVEHNVAAGLPVGDNRAALVDSSRVLPLTGQRPGVRRASAALVSLSRPGGFVSLFLFILGGPLMSAPHRSRRRGFTLIELLVVIAIIAI